MRNDVMVKIELLDQKHGASMRKRTFHGSVQTVPDLVRDIAHHLTNMATVMKDCLAGCSAVLQHTQNAPIEIDITQVGALSE